MKLTDFATLDDARAWETSEGRMLSRDRVNALLVSAGLYVKLKTIGQTADHPFQDAMAAFFDTREYSFIEGDPVGDGNILLLDSMIAAELPEISPALAQLKPVVQALSNRTVRPYENTTLHQFLVAKGTCPRKLVLLAQNGWLKITLNEAVERHAPVVWQQVGTHFVRVTSFPVVESAGEYITKVSKGFSALYVDDAYGAVQ